MPKRSEEVLVPIEPADVEEHRPRGVGRVRGVARAAAQLPEDPGIRRPEGQASPLGALAEAASVEDPLGLGRREISVDRKPRLFADEPAHPWLSGEVAASPGRAPALPDDGVGHGTPSPPVPDDGRLALVGDADGGDRSPRDAGQGLLDGAINAPPDLLGIVLDPARLREILRELFVGGSDGPAAPVENDGSAARRALVDGQNVAHVRSACPSSRGYPGRLSRGRGRSRAHGTSPGTR